MDHDHGDMDMGSDAAPIACRMSMIFHGGHSECIVFRWWNVRSLEMFILSALGIFVLTVLYEGLKFWREKLYTEKAIAIQNITMSSENRLDKLATVSSTRRSLRQSMFNGTHLLQTGLHMVQMCGSYLLMLITMTYNAYLILAVILGAGCGYFLFGWIRQKSVAVEEHCH